MSDLQYVQGLDALTQRLKTLPADVRNKVLRGSVFAGATVIKNFASAFAPVAPRPVGRGHGRYTEPGTLKRNLIVKFVTAQSGQDQVEYIITARQGKFQQKSGRDAFYARFIEFGHYSRPRGRHSIPRGSAREGVLASGAVSHFILPKKFLTPAFNRGGQLALEAITEEFRKRLDRLT